MKRLLVFILLLSFFTYPLTTETANASSAPINLGFEVNDSVLHPDKPIVYATKLGSKTIHAINFETGKKETLTLPYPANHIEIYNNQLILTQHKMSHDAYHSGPYSGAIAIVDTEPFALNRVFGVETDPYDIAVDKDGYVYITNGSGQWINMKVYSLHDQKEVPNGHKSHMRMQSTILYNEEMNKVYTIDTDLSPRDITAFEINKGVILNQYDSPYHGKYRLDPKATISPDGESLYNNSGNVFGLTAISSGDMNYKYNLGDTYNDFAFSPEEELMFAASTSGGVDLFEYQTDDYLFSFATTKKVKHLHYQNGLLIFYSENGRHYMEHITQFEPEAPEAPEIIDAAYFDEDDLYDFYDGVTDIPLDTFFLFAFDQEIEVTNPNGITVTGSSGEVEVYIEEDEDLLFVEPDYLEPNSSYTVKIGKDAIASLDGLSLTGDVQYQFLTAKEIDTTPPVLTLTASTTQPTKNDVIITAKGTDNVGVKSIKLPNGQVVSQAQATFTVSTNGTYSFTVEDTSGLKTTKSIKITNIDKEAPQATITRSTTAATKNPILITVTGTDNKKVRRIKLPNGTYVTGATATYKVPENGSYKFIIEDTAGNTISKTVKVTNIYNKVPVSPTVNRVSDRDTIITGKSVPKMTIIVKRGTTQLGTVKTSSTGEFQLTIPKQKAGAKLSVYAKDPVGQISPAKVITVIDKTPPPAPVVNKVTTKSKVVTGTAEKGATVYVYNGTKYLGKATVDSYGKYKVPIVLQKRGVTLKVHAVDKANNKSKETSIKVS